MKSVMLVPAFSAIALLAGCMGQEAEAELPMLSEGYRYESDVCHLVTESPLTLQYLDDRADLVACPKDITLIGNIDGAEMVFETEAYRVFSVPRETMGQA